MATTTTTTTTIENFFGTLLESVTVAHRFHLATGKYSAHAALNDYYDAAPAAIDDLIEAYQGIYGRVTPLRVDDLPEDDAIIYFTALRDFINDNKDLFDDDDTEVFSRLDDVLSLIDSTLYKLKELKESCVTGVSLYESLLSVKSLKDYIAENDKKKCADCDEDTDVKVDEDEDSGKVESKDDFIKYAENKFKEVFGDKLDKQRMDFTIKGLLDDNKALVDNNDWGTLVGKLNKSFGA